jgi:hypothetical protein
MPLSIQRSERIARTGPRALLRARLLNIVGAGPEVVGGRGGSRVTGAAQDARPSLLLLNPDRSDLDVEDFVRTIRQRYPKLEVVVVEAAVHVHDLPCEFGNGALKASRESPIARAASTSWGSATIAQAEDGQAHVVQHELDFTLVGDEVC